MNTVQHRKTVITKHEFHMDGPITARDIGDFVFQVNKQFKEIVGREVAYDDDYYVAGTEDGIMAYFEDKK